MAKRRHRGGHDLGQDSPLSFGTPADVNGTLYFAGADGRVRHSGCGEATARRRGRRWSRKAPTSPPPRLTNVSGTLYFISDTPRHAVDSELWRSDGTEAGTTKVKDFNSGGTTVPATSPTSTASSTSLASDGELWRSDGSEAGTTLVKRATGRAQPSLPSRASSTSRRAGGALWRSDGTPQGTTLVRELGPPALTAAGHALLRGYRQEARSGTVAKRRYPQGDEDGQEHPARQCQQPTPVPHPSTAPSSSPPRTAARQGAVEGRTTPCKTAKGKCKKG